VFAGAPDEPDPVCCGRVASVSVSGNYVIAGSGGPSNIIQIRARNQGGPNAWGLVSLFSAASGSGNIFDPLSAINGDTALLDGDPALDTGDRRSVFVSDLDGDGVRDAIDPCPRGPLNNVAGECQRSTVAHQILDDLIALTDVTSETRDGHQLITASLTNTSTTPVKNPFFEVTELTGGNVLVNADGGPGDVGATLSPDVGDGILAPGEPMRVTFRVRLQSQEPFGFFVQFHGDPVE
jgi:hypothetical protein